jgi:nickel/cobalt exporter
MSPDLIILLGTAATIGFVHTCMGPDHYVPFVALAKARRWSVTKTVWITVGCGIGHVLGSVVLGFVGIAAGITLSRLNLMESTRGEIAAWLLIAFGLVHIHEGGAPHTHVHGHTTEHAHVHDQSQKSLAAWTLFIVFVLGPCEPLIPLLLFPAAAQSPGAVWLVAAVFGVVTITTMTGVVVLSLYGLKLVSLKSAGRYAHAVAGAVILLCGVAIQLGL